MTVNMHMHHEVKYNIHFDKAVDKKYKLEEAFHFFGFEFLFVCTTSNTERIEQRYR